jgi:hypothetical protein
MEPATFLQLSSIPKSLILKPQKSFALDIFIKLHYGL